MTTLSRFSKFQFMSSALSYILLIRAIRQAGNVSSPISSNKKCCVNPNANRSLYSSDITFNSGPKIVVLAISVNTAGSWMFLPPDACCTISNIEIVYLAILLTPFIVCVFYIFHRHIPKWFKFKIFRR